MANNIGTSRTEALAFGLPLYEGPPCTKGHTSNVRRVSSGECRECSIEAGRLRRATGDATFKAAEAARRKAAKAAGRWNLDPAKVAKHRADYREKQRNSPEAVARREAAVRVKEARRIERERKAAADALARPAREAAKKEARRLKAEANAPAVAARKVMNNRLKASKRRSLKRGLVGDGTATARDVADILEAQGGRCAYCGCTDNLHLDHRHPVSAGGVHEVHNLQFLCAPHNMAKRVTPDAEYRRRIGVPAVTQWDGYRWRLLCLAAVAA